MTLKIDLRTHYINLHTQCQANKNKIIQTFTYVHYSSKSSTPFPKSHAYCRTTYRETMIWRELYALTQFCNLRLPIDQYFVHPHLDAKQLGYDWACYDRTSDTAQEWWHSWTEACTCSHNCSIPQSGIQHETTFTS